MTFNDFVVECMLFPYSQAHYDICKECAEVELGEKYLESQSVLSDNIEDIAGVGIDTSNITITESYLMESADADTLTALYEKTEEKKKGVLSKLASVVKGWIATFGKFLARIAGVEIPKQGEVEFLKSELEKMNITANQYKKYCMQNVAKLKQTGIELVAVKGELAKANKRADDAEQVSKNKSEEIGNLKAELDSVSLAYANLRRTHQATVRFTSNLSAAISANQLADVINDYASEVNSGGTSSARVRSIQKRLEGYINDSHTGNGIKFTSSPDAINKATSTLKAADAKFNEKKDTESASADKIKACNELQVLISKALADTIKAYNAMAAAVNRSNHSKAAKKVEDQ